MTSSYVFLLATCSFGTTIDIPLQGRARFIRHIFQPDRVTGFINKIRAERVAWLL